MKKLLVEYYHLTKFKDLEWEHNSEYEYSKKLRTKIIDTCLKKGYSVMICSLTDGEVIWIDNGRFKQR